MKTYSSVAFKKLGLKTCENAYRLWQGGSDFSAVGFELNLTVKQADLAIAAWRRVIDSARVGDIVRGSGINSYSVIARGGTCTLGNILLRSTV